MVINNILSWSNRDAFLGNRLGVVRHLPVIYRPAPKVRQGWESWKRLWKKWQKMQSVDQCVFDIVWRQCGSQGLFAEFLPLVVQYQWNMCIQQRGVTQALLKIYLSRCRLQQVGSADHMGDALHGIIHHHCKLIAKQAICTFDHKVAYVLANVMLLPADNPVFKADPLGGCFQTPGDRCVWFNGMM